jgi:BRCC36 C-terminal helical domain
MDAQFVGVIVSCFTEFADTFVNSTQVIAFQSLSLPGGGHERLAVPLELVSSHRVDPTRSKEPNLLLKSVQLQEILFEEERTAYLDAVGHTSLRDGRLARIHQAGVYQKSLTRLLECGIAPLLQELHQAEQKNQHTIGKLRHELARLQQQQQQQQQ